MSKTNSQMDNDNQIMNGYTLTKRIDKVVFETNMKVLLSQLQKHDPTITMKVRYVPGLNMSRFNIYTASRYDATFRAENGNQISVETWGKYKVGMDSYSKAYKIVAHHEYVRNNRLSGMEVHQFAGYITEIFKRVFYQEPRKKLISIDKEAIEDTQGLIRKDLLLEDDD